MTQENDKIRQMLKEAMELQERGKAGEAKAEASKDSGNIITEAQAVRDGIRGAGRVATFLKSLGLAIYNVFKPVFDYAIFPLCRGYKKLWDKVAYKNDKKTGDRKLARGRAGTMALTTIFMASAIVPGAIGGPARDVLNGMVFEPIHDSALMATAYHKNETLYLSDSKDSFQGDVHSVKGCKTITCEEQDAVYFRVKPSLVHNFWNSVHAMNKAHDAGKGVFGIAKEGAANFFFIPDLVTATIAPGLNKCEVNSYGVRWRVLQSMQSYPTLLSAKCTPVFAHASAGNTAATAAAQPAPAAPAAMQAAM